MGDPPDEPENPLPSVGEFRFASDFEPNTFIYEANTSTPPRLLDSARVAPPAAPSTRPSGPVARVAHFRVLGKIGEGGMGVVYRANDEYLQRLVALKVLSASKGDVEEVESTQRLLREARAASRISHPNVVTVFAAGEAEGLAFIAMEFVEGTELGKLIGSEGIEIRRALEIAAQIADGLGAAHAQGIVHRDVKPANVLVCAGDRVKILDFGLAKPWRLASGDRPQTVSPEDLPDSVDALDFYNTQAGVIWGSLRYMSPEQFTGEAVDARSDVFSLGILLYQMITGVVPFAAKNPREQLAALLRHEPAPLRRFRMRAPDSVQAIVDRALSKQRDGRFPTAGAMADELRTALRRLRDLGDVEIEDASVGSHRLTASLPPVAPADERTAEGPRELAYGTDSITFFPPGSPFDAVILSPNVYPWTPRGARLPGGSAGGSAVSLEGETFEVVAADQQHAHLNRYFLSRWPANSIIRRVFDYTPEVVARFGGEPKPSSSKLGGLFGRRRRDS